MHKAELNGLDYRYVYGFQSLRLSVNISPIDGGAGSIVETGTVGEQIRLYYHQDLRGTVDYLTSPVSQKVESWTHYNEWGEITHNAVVKCGYREFDLVKNYTGHEYDAVLNLYYAKARMYDAENRRFTSVDPILDASRYDVSGYVTNPAQLVQYLYVQNNPLIFVDPTGKYLVTRSITGPVDLDFDGDVIMGEVYGDTVYAHMRDLLLAYGIFIQAESQATWSDKEQGFIFETRKSENPNFTATFNRNQNKLTITNLSTGKSDVIDATESYIFGSSNYENNYFIRPEYFQQVMCKLGYKKELSITYSEDAEILLAGILTEADKELQNTNEVAYSALKQLNATWVEVYKRTIEKYDTTGMKEHILALADIIRGIAK